MVDSHQVLIENCNENVTSNGEPNLIPNAIPMNEIFAEQSSDLNGSCSDLKTIENNCEQNGDNLRGKRGDDGAIMCDLASKREPSTNDGPNCTTNAIPHTVTPPNGDAAELITATNTNNESQIVTTKHDDASIVNGNQQKISKSIDLNQHNREATTSTADQLEAHGHSSAKFQSNIILSVENKITNKMDSRKVEPIRININRDPIKTKIKLGPSPHDCQTVSLKSASSSSSSSSSSINDDECDNISGMATHENTQSYPKITIKPIVKPAMNHHNNQTTAGLQASSSSSSASHEAIPKLKIKKIESSSSSSTANNQTPKPTLLAALNSDEITTNYQTHLLSESSTTVPT